MALQPHSLLTPQEYLAFERQAEQKHEFLNGEIFAMVGASENHNLIVMNTGAELHRQLKKSPCKIYSNDMRVKVDPSGLYTYPDLVVVCETPRFEDAKRDTLLNPKLIIEVLSDSTEAYDRGGKFEYYRQLESLAEYLLINQYKPHVERFVRQSGDASWLLTEAHGLEAKMSLSAIDCELSFAEVYAKIEF